MGHAIVFGGSPVLGHFRFKSAFHQSFGELLKQAVLADGEHCAETKSIAERKLKVVEEKLYDLAAIHKALKGLIQSCQRTAGGQGCPIIDNFKESAR